MFRKRDRRSKIARLAILLAPAFMPWAGVALADGGNDRLIVGAEVVAPCKIAVEAEPLSDDLNAPRAEIECAADQPRVETLALDRTPGRAIPDPEAAETDAASQYRIIEIVF
jgi:hypothetical protein